MGAKQSLVALGFTVAMGVGVGVAAHEAPDLDARADRIVACLPVRDAAGKWVASQFAETEFCKAAPRTRAEVDTLRSASDNYKLLGVVGICAVIGGTITLAESIDVPDQAERLVIYRGDPPTAGSPPPESQPDAQPPTAGAGAEPPPQVDPSTFQG
jgi:hypothetical protein